MTTYATLKSDIAGWLLRDDLTAAIPSFVRLAESSIKRDLRLRQMIRTYTLTISAQSMSLPEDFVEMERIVIDSDTNWELQYLPPPALYASQEYRDSGDPEFYTIEGDYIIFAPAPTDTPDALMSYFKWYSALTNDSDTNRLLTNHYDVYLYGALSHASPYIKEDERVALWNAGYKDAIGSLRHRNKTVALNAPLKRIMPA